MLFTLIILSMLLLLGVTVTATVNSQTRSAIATDKSVVAFFIAESGAELVLNTIYTGTYDSSALSNLAANCNQGKLSDSMSAGTWEILLYDSSGNALTSCSDTGWRAKVDTLKSDGTHAQTVRSIRMSVKPL